MPLVSVLLPTFNGEMFLEEQICSILQQSSSDLEILIVDDGSVDRTTNIVDDFTRRDSRVHRLAAEGNLGQNRRLTDLLKSASGRYIAIADQDDIWDHNRNELLIKAIEDRAIALGRSDLIGSTGSSLNLTALSAINVDPGKVGPLSALFSPLVSAHAALIRTDWLQPEAFFSNLPFDQILGIEALFSDGLVYVDDAVVRHRIHSNNQFNGRLGQPVPARRTWSRYRAKSSWRWIGPARLFFTQVLDQLSRSNAIGKEKKTMFKGLAGMCWHQWHGIPSGSIKMANVFHQSLDRFAASPDDLQTFSRHINWLTGGLLSRDNIRSSWQRYWA